MASADRPIAAPEGTYPLDEWPLDVQRTDESGDVDLSLIEHNLSLTPAERVQQHYEFRMFAEQLREAGKKFYGSAVSDPAADE